MHHIIALAFLLPEEIPAAFDQVKLILPENTVRITEYFEEYYIRGRVRNFRNRTARHLSPLFPPEIWSVNDLVKLDYPRTQNIIEG